MSNLRRLLFIWILLPFGAWGLDSAHGWCELGGEVVMGPGSSQSTTKVQRSFPSCLVNVYLSGTSTHASIYSDSSGTPLGNPFTATSKGYWSFFGQNGNYDVTISGAGISAPFTFGSILFNSPSRFYIDPTSPAYGVKCDGSTNDATGLQAAINAAIAQNLPLQLPQGECKYGTTLTINGSIEVKGTGSNNASGSFLVYSGTSDAILVHNNSSTVFAADFANLGVLSSSGTGRYAFNLNNVSQSYFTNISVNNTSQNPFSECFHIEDSTVLFFDQIVATQADTCFHLDNVGANVDVSDIWIKDANLFQNTNVFWPEGVVTNVILVNSHVEQYSDLIHLDNTSTPQFSGHVALNVSNFTIRDSYILANNYTDFSPTPRLISGVGVSGKYFYVQGINFLSNRTFFITPSPSTPFNFDINAGGTISGHVIIHGNLWGQLTGTLIASNTASILFSLRDNFDEYAGTPPRTADFGPTVNGWGVYGRLGLVGLGANNTAPLYTADVFDNRSGKFSQAGVRRATGQSNSLQSFVVTDAAGTYIAGMHTDDNTNIFLGRNSGAANTVSGSAGTNNAFVGAFAGLVNTSGKNLTGVGSIALVANTTGTEDTGVGGNALGGNTTGANNTGVGYFAGVGDSGSANTTGSNNTYLGVYTGPGSAQRTNCTSIGYQAKCDANNEIFLGNNSVSKYSFGGRCALYIGTGSPNSVVTGFPCDLYLNVSGGASTTLYVKQSGSNTNTGWVGK